MRGKGLIAVLTGAVLVGSVMRAGAQDADLQARIYKANLVQAMDECLPPGVGTMSVDGIGACTATNSMVGNTDGTPFNTGKILVKARSSFGQVLTIVKSSRSGKLLANHHVRTQLVLRITRSTDHVTWVDQTLLCPLVTVPTTGNLVQRTSLTGCGLPAALANQATHKEVVQASVIDNDTNAVIAVPGVRKKP